VTAAHPEQEFLALVATAKQGCRALGDVLLPEALDGDRDPVGW